MRQVIEASEINIHDLTVIRMVSILRQGSKGDAGVRDEYIDITETHARCFYGIFYLLGVGNVTFVRIDRVSLKVRICMVQIRDLISVGCKDLCAGSSDSA